MASQSLNDHGIRSEVVGSKDYTSHVTGSDAGSFDLLVEQEKIPEAEEIIRSHQINIVPDEPLAPSAQSYLKKAVIFAIVAVAMVPLLTNYISLKNLFHYWTLEKNPTKKIFMSFVVLVLQVPGCISGYLIIKSIPHSF